MVPVNIWAVLVSGIAAMIIGWLWYGPLFGKQWVASLGISQAEIETRMKNSGSSSYVLMFIGALITAFMLAHAVIFTGTYLGSMGAATGALVGLGSWLGFVAPSSVSGVLWEKKPWKWWFIFNGYYLVMLVVMGVILAVWM